MPRRILFATLILLTYGIVFPESPSASAEPSHLVFMPQPSRHSHASTKSGCNGWTIRLRTADTDLLVGQQTTISTKVKGNIRPRHCTVTIVDESDGIVVKKCTQGTGCRVNVSESDPGDYDFAAYLRTLSGTRISKSGTVTVTWRRPRSPNTPIPTPTFPSTNPPAPVATATAGPTGAPPSAPPSGAAPNTPSNVHVTTPDPYDLSVTWQDNSSNESGFTVYVNGSPVGNAPANATSGTVAGAQPNTQYCVQVAAFNSYGTSPLSFSTCVRTPGVATQPTPVPTQPPVQNYSPTAPSNLQMNGQWDPGCFCTNLTFSWTDRSVNEAGFKLYCRDESPVGTGQKVIATLGANTTTWTVKVAAVTYVEAGTRYYWITAYNQYGESGPSNVISVTGDHGCV